jgi:hypothetical protein
MPTMLKQVVITAMSVFLIGFAGAASAADTTLIIVSHEVADFNAFKKAFDAGKGNRAKVGLTDRYLLRDANKPNFVIVVLESDSGDGAKKYVSDPGFLARVKKASVSGTADIKIGTTGAAGN